MCVQARPPEMLRLLLKYDTGFARQQQSYQQHYTRLCQALKRAQRCVGGGDGGGGEGMIGGWRG